MEHFKQFIKDKGLYLACLAVVFAATAAGVLALRGILNHFAGSAQLRENPAQQETPWQDDAAVNQPDTAQPEPTRTPAPTTAPTPTPAPAATPSPQADPAPAPSADSGTAGKFWKAQPLAPFSGDELVYNATLGDWRTHNGVDLAAPAGTEIPAAKAGRVTAVQDDALWGGVVEVTDADGALWRYCGLAPTVVPGDDLSLGTPLGTAAALPAEADLASHIHLEYLVDNTYTEPPL